MHNSAKTKLLYEEPRATMAHIAPLFPLMLLLAACIPQIVQSWGSSLRCNGKRVSRVIKESRFADSIDESRRTFVDVAFATASVVFLPAKNAHGMVTDPKTGIALPEEGEIAAAVPMDWSDIFNNPFEGSTSAASSQFGRLDASPDSVFYADPRFVEHVDEQAVKAMTNYISREAIPNGSDVSVLDLCSSWTSHIDLTKTSSKPKRISGLGMNSKELERNPVLDDWVVRDLNDNPTLPHDDNSFDVVLCQLSIDYLIK
jgi:hypothetical protein